MSEHPQPNPTINPTRDGKYLYPDSNLILRMYCETSYICCVFNCYFSTKIIADITHIMFPLPCTDRLRSCEEKHSQ